MKKSTDSPTLPSNPKPARSAAPTEKDLIEHCIQFMADKEDIKTLFENTPMRYRPKDSYKKLAGEFLKFHKLLSIDQVRSLLRDRWMAKRSDFKEEDILANLKKLEGHDWHKARPSNLHLSIQDMVRDCLAGKTDLDDYLSKGTDIIKHEYFMTATHDICEYRIIDSFRDDVIPSTQYRSVSDFIFDGIPYDLKVTTYPDDWVPTAGQTPLERKKDLAEKLYGEADSLRDRKTANQCKFNWGHNRMYYVVGDQDKWLKKPKDTIQYLLEGLKDEANFFELDVEEYHLRVCLVEQ